MTPQDIKELIGTAIVLMFLFAVIKRALDLRNAEREKKKNVYNPDEYDR